MKYIGVLVSCLVLSLSSYAAGNIVKHKIKSGETLYTIAHANHTTIEEVRKLNKLKKGEILRVGRVLKVPTNTYFPNKKSKKPSSKMAKHTIQKGETLFTIARKHHTTIDEVRKANGLKKGQLLKIGQVLKVPTNTYFPNKKSKTTAPKMAKHTIQKGETLFTIARKHHTTIKEVQEANRLKKGEILKIGRVLKVPVNTYNVPKTKVAQHNTQKKKKVKVAKRSKSSHKKLVASLSKLETISLKKDHKVQDKKGGFTALLDIFSSSDERSEKITKLAKKKLGRRYVWGATGTKNTFDCSGFTKYVYEKNGISIPRTSIKQSKYGKYVPKNKLKKGDLVFFDTSKEQKGYVNHVGIYLGNGKFIHASSAKKKVVITSLNKAFYAKRYKGARRPSS